MKYLLSISLLYCFTDAAFSQQAKWHAGLRFDPKWVKTNPGLPMHPVSLLFSGNPSTLLPGQKNLLATWPYLPAAWCYHDLAFFCKLEVKMEKAVRFPVKFRLGDVEYVDRLEGKE
ncbi:MAG: hypothetical protein HY842_13550 [Bacteroidetes bacterium]|nr:hypothetical protein [Bacteroidota bacterium]